MFSLLIENVGMYGTEWRSWWRSLQPPHRIGTRDWPLLKVGLASPSAHWDNLKKGSSHGFALLLVSLIWWEENLRLAKDRKAFQSALDDVHSVLQALSGNLSGKPAHSKRINDDICTDTRTKRYAYSRLVWCAC